MNATMQEILKPLFGKKCCRVKVGGYRSLSMGFGGKIYHNNPRLNDTYYGEWEIGTYYGCWRVIEEGMIVCGPTDRVEDDDLEKKLKEIEFGAITSIDNLTPLDVRIVFDSGIFVDFLPQTSRDDEYVHIFCPDNKYIRLRPGGEWKTGPLRK